MAKKQRQPDPRLQKLLYRRQEASFVLGVSVREIDKMISEQVLPTHRYGKCVLIGAADIQRVAETILMADMLQGAASMRKGSRKADGSGAETDKV